MPCIPLTSRRCNKCFYSVPDSRLISKVSGLSVVRLCVVLSNNEYNIPEGKDYSSVAGATITCNRDITIAKYRNEYIERDELYTSILKLWCKLHEYEKTTETYRLINDFANTLHTGNRPLKLSTAMLRLSKVLEKAAHISSTKVSLNQK